METSISDVILEIGKKAGIFLDKQEKFKKKLDPIFNDIESFGGKILEHIKNMPKFDRSKGNKQHELLTASDNPPKKDYIWCSNYCGTGQATNTLIIVYPWDEQNGHFVGWMPSNLFNNNPIEKLLSMAVHYTELSIKKPPIKSEELLNYQYATVAILHDIPNLINRRLLYFSNQDSISVRVGKRFIEYLGNNNDPQLINQLYNAYQSVKIDIETLNFCGTHQPEFNMKYDVFISHASEDKKVFVEPLANALRKAGIIVWYDRFELKLGDSLREKIDYGLSNSRYGVVILSKSFFSKGWPRTELDSLVTRQNSEGKKVILPIWHEVTGEDVRKFSPILASKYAAKSTDTLESIVDQIEKVLNENPTYPKCVEDKRESTGTGQGEKTAFIPPPKFTDKNGKVFIGNEAWEKMWEKFLEFGRYTIPEKPFANKPITITDNNYGPINGYRELLTEEERELLLKAIPELSDAGLEAVMRRVYNMGDDRIKALTWKEIFVFCKDYINSSVSDKPAKTDQCNKDAESEREGYLEPKPPELLQKILWVLKYGKKYWKLIIATVIILGILFDLKYNFHSRFFNLLTKKTATNSGRTQLYPRTKKRVDDFYESIKNEKLDPWLFINTGVKVQVTKYNGDIINCSGVMFTGSPRNVFWSDDFIPPFIEDAIIKVFDQTIDECRRNNLNPKIYIYEARGILDGFIYRIYNRMADMDQRLLKQAHPENTGRRDVKDEIEKMHKCLEEQYNAALLLASGNENGKYL